MAKVNVIFWTQGGNTSAMADAIGKGVTESGNEANVVAVGADSAALVNDSKAFALGCPAMGDEVLEEDEMEPFVASIEGNVSGKTILLFGSYGWGDGQWMRDWVARMQAAGATVLGGDGIICQEAPDADALAKLEKAGAELAALA
ncbi:MAG: flavodoxin domain-containing protein [Thermoguttaceae bacterium]|nr:flavodoxin domain-containing protein [Thermoguttaceae bacterium]